MDQLARFLGRSFEEIVHEALQERLDQLSTEKLQAEISAFEQMHPQLRANYFGQFVAVHRGKVIDSDPDFETLFLRAQEQFGDLPVLLRQVGDSPVEEWRFRSPRMEAI